ncbi:MAG: phosphosulfolactate synthase [Clostridia bacterium]|nr:phosphosulfolactate synthase [Clostridia bacterium]
MINHSKAWQGIITFPIGGRTPKPRSSGLTMVMDKGLGLAAVRDLLETGAPYIDFIKLGFGTSALVDEKFLKEKINLIRSYGVDIYPGGTFLEIACQQNKIPDYLAYAQDIGFTFLEVSDGTITMTPQVRAALITGAREAGFGVITEVGKKDPRDQLPITEIIQQVKFDLAHGAYKVILEGRESGKGIGLYDNNGEVKQDDLATFTNSIDDIKAIIWEAPLKSQQQELLMKFGPNVNMGNINPSEVLALEALRVGLRGDTFRFTLWEEKHPPNTST